MKPAALTQFSAQMARELEGAATHFARSVRTLGDDRRASAPGTPAEAYQDMMETDAPALYRLSDADRETASSFTAAARQIEMLTDSALEFAARGITTLDEVFRVTEQMDATADIAEPEASDKVVSGAGGSGGLSLEPLSPET